MSQLCVWRPLTGKVVTHVQPYTSDGAHFGLADWTKQSLNHFYFARIFPWRYHRATGKHLDLDILSVVCRYTHIEFRIDRFAHQDTRRR